MHYFGVFAIAVSLVDGGGGEGGDGQEGDVMRPRGGRERGRERGKEWGFKGNQPVF